MAVLLITVAGSAVGGALFGSLLACVPGLHVCNSLGVLVLAWQALSGPSAVMLPPEILIPAVAGLVVAYAMHSAIPSILLAAPDESALFTVLPGQEYLIAGRGYEGTMLAVSGSVAGLFVLVFVAGPLAPRILPPAWTVLRAHVHWILWCVIAYMLMSEWPKSEPLGQAGLRKLARAWRSLAAGLATFFLSGFLGFLLLYRSPLSAEVAFQNLMPAFVGLFTLPWLLLNLAARMPLPSQAIPARIRLEWPALIQGSLAGVLGGGFAAFFPVVTGGIGGFLAGQATALNDRRAFLISQGAARLIYYVGGFLMLFVPTLSLTRGGVASMFRTLPVSGGQGTYWMALAGVAWAGAAAALLARPLTRHVLGAVERHGQRRVSWFALGVIVALVAGMTGWRGMSVALVAAGIGLIPPLFGARRMNCLGVILLPIACNLSGIGPGIARWLRLL